MGKDSGKRAARKRVAEIATAAHDDEEKLKRAASRRLAKLEKDLAVAHRMQERHRSRLEAATAEADQISVEIAELLRRASEPAADGARKVGRAAGELLDEAAVVVSDAAVVVKDAAESVVGAARRARPKRAVAKAPGAAEGAAAATVEPAATAQPAPRRPRRARAATPPSSGPSNG
jgi:hypothetical protein